MSKYKILPKVSPKEYEISEELSLHTYKLTEESQILRDKLIDFLTKKTIHSKNMASI